MQISPAKREVRCWHCDSRIWAHYKPRPGDIVIGTSAKCGTTWTQQIVSSLVFQSPEPRPIGMVSSWLDARFFPVTDEQKLATLEGQTHRRFIKTHLQLDAIPIYDEVKYIHVAREGRDACLSWHHHRIIHTKGVFDLLDAAGMGDPLVGKPGPRPKQDPRDFFHDWMDDSPFPDWKEAWPAQKYFDLERSYWAERKLPNLLMVHYADLKADLDGEMRRIAAFLDIPVDEALWPSLVASARFENMKSNSDKLGPGMEMAFEGGMNGFLDKGKNARWRDVLTEDDLVLWRERVRRETTPALARWLEGGRLVAGDPRTSQD